MTGIVNGSLFRAVVAGQLSPGHDSTELVNNYLFIEQVTTPGLVRLEVVPSQEENYQHHISTIVTGLQK